MIFELYFVMGVLTFALIALAIMAEHFITTHGLLQGRTIGTVMENIEKKYPQMCDRNVVFYCFFKRDTFNVPKTI